MMLYIILVISFCIFFFIWFYTADEEELEAYVEASKFMNYF